jgi:hypothetical protein
MSFRYAQKKNNSHSNQYVDAKCVLLVVALSVVIVCKVEFSVALIIA